MSLAIGAIGWLKSVGCLFSLFLHRMPMNVKLPLVCAALTLAGAWLYSKRAVTYDRLDPELRSPLLRFRSPPYTPLVVKVMRLVLARLPEPADIAFELYHVPAADGAPDVPVYVYRPDGVQQPTAALLYIHGGGFMIGSARSAHAICAGLADDLGIVVANVDYRLAPEVPFPGALDDCYAALKWMKQQAASLHIDPERIAVMGESAGGGLAAALAQLAHDRGEIKPVFQLLAYPMLDDRTALMRDHEGRGEFLWTPGANRLGWTSYLGHAPMLDAAPEYASPARREDLVGLAPAWIGAGTLDLLYPESKAYARRLNEAGVACEFYEVDGAYHGFDGMSPGASISKAFIARRNEALRRGLRLA